MFPNVFLCFVIFNICLRLGSPAHPKHTEGTDIIKRS